MFSYLRAENLVILFRFYHDTLIHRFNKRQNLKDMLKCFAVSES